MTDHTPTPPADDTSAPSLPERVADLEADMSQAARLIKILADQSSGEEPAEAEGEPAQRPPWLLLGDIDDDASFSTWVTWLGSHYTEPTTGKSIVPDCWRNHDAVVAELGTLWQAWVFAFLHPKSHPDNAQNWHDRWLPGFMSRRTTWFHTDCTSGRCHQETRR